MLELFRSLILALAIAAPGQVYCNKPIIQATVCSVAFENPHFVEVVTPRQIARVRVLLELKNLGY
jgi:hypothetical protein